MSTDNYKKLLDIYEKKTNEEIEEEITKIIKIKNSLREQMSAIADEISKLDQAVAILDSIQERRGL